MGDISEVIVGEVSIGSCSNCCDVFIDDFFFLRGNGQMVIRFKCHSWELCRDIGLEPALGQHIVEIILFVPVKFLLIAVQKF